VGEDRRERRGVRLTLREASAQMGISKDALRQRIRRGTLQSDKGEDGRVYVYVDTSTVRDVYPEDRADAVGPLADELRDRIRYLERQVEEERDARRRADTLLAQLMQRIPELEAPREAPESPDSPSPTDTPTEAPEEAQEGVQRPWWRRMFGG
jgi:hypothetical protein